MDQEDLNRFFESMNKFNTLQPIGSIRNSRRRGSASAPLLGKEESCKLVEFVSYCLNPNHYHLLLRQLVDGGIEKFMHKVGTGYTMYFNTKYERSGSLFQGKFKDTHISSNTQLLHTSVYVNMNNQFKDKIPELSRSSWDEYIRKIDSNFCNKKIILDQFENLEDYVKFSKSTLEDIKQRKIR